jgi:hypothetical protein
MNDFDTIVDCKKILQAFVKLKDYIKKTNAQKTAINNEINQQIRDLEILTGLKPIHLRELIYSDSDWKKFNQLQTKTIDDWYEKFNRKRKINVIENPPDLTNTTESEGDDEMLNSFIQSQVPNKDNDDNDLTQISKKTKDDDDVIKIDDDIDVKKENDTEIISKDTLPQSSTSTPIIAQTKTSRLSNTSTATSVTALPTTIDNATQATIKSKQKIEASKLRAQKLLAEKKAAAAILGATQKASETIKTSNPITPVQKNFLQKKGKQYKFLQISMSTDTKVSTLKVILKP